MKEKLAEIVTSVRSKAPDLVVRTNSNFEFRSYAVERVCREERGSANSLTYFRFAGKVEGIHLPLTPL